MAAFYILAVDDRNINSNSPPRPKSKREAPRLLAIGGSREHHTGGNLRGHPLGGPPEISQDDDPAEGL